jgi:RHS repeat-associated protein
MGFTGQWLDSATGLQYNHHRWYDAGTGRWLSEDPIGFAGGDGNLYRYVGNQASTFVDDAGLWRHPSLRNELFGEVDDWSYGTSTGWSIVDAPMAALGSAAGNLIGNPRRPP